MKERNWWSVANLRRQKDAFGIYWRGKAMFIDRVNKLKALSDTELKKMKEDKEIRKYLYLKSGGSKSHGGGAGSSASIYEIAAGKREILGTKIGDGLRMIDSGKVDELRKDWRNFRAVIGVLDVAGLVDRKSGRFDRQGIKECLKKNRIVHKR